MCSCRDRKKKKKGKIKQLPALRPVQGAQMGGEPTSAVLFSWAKKGADVTLQIASPPGPLRRAALEKEALKFAQMRGFVVVKVKVASKAKGPKKDSYSKSTVPTLQVAVHSLTQGSAFFGTWHIALPSATVDELDSGSCWRLHAQIEFRILGDFPILVTPFSWDRIRWHVVCRHVTGLLFSEICT